MTDHETTQIYEKAPSSSETTRRILGLGSLTLLTITAAAILHVNQPEFIFDRFLGITEFEYSLFDSVLYLSYLLFGLLTGALSDRWSRRREFVLLGTSGSIVFYWLMTTTLTYPLLLTYRFLQGAFTVMVWQTLMTLAIDFSGPYDRGRNMGIFGAFLAVAMGMGPAIGGVFASYGVFAPYYAAAILNVVVLFSSFFGLRDPIVTESRPTLMHSLTVAKRHPKLVVPGVFNFIDRLHIGFILTALPLFLSVVLGLSESLRGLSLAVFAMPFIILQYPMGKLSDRYGRYAPLVVGSIGYGLTLSAL
ncbi:MAG: MFS transporter, partial [Candidatus Sifarchaeia archaeon]